jgi:hypothetical protein
MILCAEPAELYRMPARALIGTVLEGWLGRHLATPFELLHNPELAAALERSGLETQHAIQKIAVPAALARGVNVHDIVRQLQRLTDQAMGRLLTDQKTGALARFTPDSFAAACAGLAGHEDAPYRLGAGVAALLGQATSWSAKIGLLLDLADAAPRDEPLRAPALALLEEPLREILGLKAARADLVGGPPDLGGALLALTAVAHPQAMTTVIQVRPGLSPLRPVLPQTAERLAKAFAQGLFAAARQDVSFLILHDFGSRRRLRPDDGVGEIECFRMLAVCLTAASGGFMPADDVRAAVVERSRLMVDQHLLDTLLASASPAAQLATLAAILENVAGDANRRRALQVLEGALATRRLEDTASADPQAALAALGALYRRAQRAGVGVAGLDALLDAIGQIGGRIEAAHRIVRNLVDGLGARDRKVAALECMASAETAPPGPAVERAAAALKRFV